MTNHIQVGPFIWRTLWFIEITQATLWFIEITQATLWSIEIPYTLVY